MLIALAVCLSLVVSAAGAEICEGGVCETDLMSALQAKRVHGNNMPRADAAFVDVGVGIADTTGPAADVVLMGYGNSEQHAAGIAMRLHARAFIFVDKSDGSDKRLVYVNVDMWACTEVIRRNVVRRLGQEIAGGLYKRENVVIAGTHAHSTPSGYSEDFLLQSYTYGYVKQSTDAIVDRIVEAVKVAHGKVRPATVLVGHGSVDNKTIKGCPMPNCAQINRSPRAYSFNPPEERAQYKYNVPHGMDMLKILDAYSNEPIGMLNWFPVHGTSYGVQNRMITGDNKGYAEYMFEHTMNGREGLAGYGPFVAAFATANHGDISPNIDGPWCTGGPDAGKPCNENNSCPDHQGKQVNSLCLSRGPGNDYRESARIIGDRQFRAAWKIYEEASIPMVGGIDYRHRFVDMSNFEVKMQNGSVRTCKPAMGVAFAAGTTDGPSDINAFIQGESAVPFPWNVLGNILAEPPDEVKQCHAPKPILLYTGGMEFPYAWAATVVPVHLVRIGQFIIAAVPTEFTTMAGRRTCKAIKDVFVSHGVLDDSAVCIVQSTAGDYSDYTTTYEEYQAQMYEGGSTVFGPHTHAAYTQILTELAIDMVKGITTSHPSIHSADMSKQMIEGQTGVVLDKPPAGKHFGSAKKTIREWHGRDTFQPGETVNMTMWASNPRNNLRRGHTFMEVQKLEYGAWKTWADDNDWETYFEWDRPMGASATSWVTLHWEIPKGTPAGEYRFVYHGDSKFANHVSAWNGTSTSITVAKYVLA